MPELRKLALFLVTLLALGACRAPVGATLPDQPGNPSGSADAPTQALIGNSGSPLPPSSEATPSPAFDPTATPNPLRRPKYTLRAVLDYARHHLAVEERIDYTNRTPLSILHLLLIVEPSRYPDVFHLTGLAWADGEPILDYEREVGSLRIPLSAPLAPGESIHLEIAYELSLPAPDPDYYGRPVPFGYSARQTNLVDWYPFLPPYLPAEVPQLGQASLTGEAPLTGQPPTTGEAPTSGQGWLAHQAGFFGEHLVFEASDFEVQIRLADARSDLVIAASAPAQTGGGWHTYQHLEARNFAFSVSDQYVTSSKTVDGVTIFGYAFPFDAAAGDAALQATAEALSIYNDLFGPYPHPTLSVVEADFLDGMEYDGLYFLSKGFYNSYSGGHSDYLIAIAAHETAHQWWFARVGNDQAVEPWLDEALSTYSERVFYENLYPESLDWWWGYRINYYDPSGWVDGSIYNPGGYRPYRDAVYLNGALFLESLREAVGDQVFFAFLHAYAERFSGALATGDDFFALLKGFSQEDLTPAIEKYFQN